MNDEIQEFLGACDQDWEALVASAWRERLLSSEPKPGRVREHKRCLDLASELTAPAPEPMTLQIIPTWVGCNEDSEPGPHWFVSHAVKTEDSFAAPWEVGPRYEDAPLSFDSVLSVEVKRWSVASIVDGSKYAPGILRLKEKRYGVLETRLYAVESYSSCEGDALPRPTAEVPCFSQYMRARVAGLSQGVLQQLAESSFSAECEH